MEKSKQTEDQLLEQFNIEELEERYEMITWAWVETTSTGYSYLFWWELLCPDP